MAGIGKTTIAEVVYQRFCNEFEGCFFLSNVREKSQKGDLTDLQIQLLFTNFRGSKSKDKNLP